MGNFRGKTALMWSSSQGRHEAVSVLLAAGAKVKIISALMPIMFEVNVLMLLIKINYIQVNKGDYDGVTALMWAAGSETSGDHEHKKGLLEKVCLYALY